MLLQEYIREVGLDVAMGIIAIYFTGLWIYGIAQLILKYEKHPYVLGLIGVGIVISSIIVLFMLLSYSYIILERIMRSYENMMLNQVIQERVLINKINQTNKIYDVVMIIQPDSIDEYPSCLGKKYV